MNAILKNVGYESMFLMYEDIGNTRLEASEERIGDRYLWKLQLVLLSSREYYQGGNWYANMPVMLWHFLLLAWQNYVFPHQ